VLAFVVIINIAQTLWAKLVRTYRAGEVLGTLKALAGARGQQGP
jgi:hypothetical protein